MRRLILLAFAILAPGRISAQGILPDSFAGWHAQGASQPFAGFMPEEWKALSSEEGFVSGETRNYSQGGDTLTVTLDRMKDPSGAYSAYTFMRSADMHRAHFSEHSSVSSGKALILAGNFVLTVTGSNVGREEAALKILVEQVSARADHGPYPTLWQHMPQRGLVHASDRYVLGPAGLNQLLPLAQGDWLGFAGGAEAEVARYDLNGQQMTLLLADLPTPQAASERLKHLGTFLNINGQKGDDAGPPVFAKRSMTLLALVSGARTKEQAEKLLGPIESNMLLTWNEPSSALADADAGMLIVSIIYGTGVLCVFALIAGLAFGGVRLAVKRALPGKVFDRDDQLQVLQLGIFSKPIEVQDFYGLGRAAKK